MADTLFISHASEDAGAVGPIVAYLEAHGVACWISSRDIPPRAIYAEAITKGMNDASACAVIVSRAANESDAIKRELELASHYKKPFIPIRIDATEPGLGLDYYLRNTQWIDYARERDRALDRIVTHMRTDTAAPRPAARPQPSYSPPPPPAYDPTPAKKGPSALWIAIGATAALILVAVVFIAMMGNAVQQANTPAGPVQVADTRWWGSWTYDENNMGWRFNADGTACWGNSYNNYEACSYTWTLDGNQLAVIHDGGVDSWRGTVTNDSYIGAVDQQGEVVAQFDLYRD